nr:hypothetical protein [Candidatus Cloacimonadota bacterium]
MGRAVLIFVMLMTTIFASILINLNERVSGVPDVLIVNQLKKESENVSDFALRNAIRNAGSVGFLDTYLEDEDFSGELTFTQSFTNFNIGNSVIDSLRYSFSDSQEQYKVESFIRTSLQGHTVSRHAEMAFDYPYTTTLVTKPSVLYLEMERLNLFPWLFQGNNYLPDSSGNNYEGVFEGFTLISNTVPWGGAFSRYCAKFDGINDYIVVKPQNEPDEVDSLNTDNSFSLLTFAKIDKDGRWFHEDEQGTLLWIPSEPSDPNLRNKPSAGIWYDTADHSMHFAVTLDDADNTMLEAVVPHTRTAKIYFWLLGIQIFNVFHYEYPWSSYALTYNHGVLKAYINGVLRATVTGPDVRAYPSRYGMTIGRRDLRGSGISNEDYKYFCGIMDQTGMHHLALSDMSVSSWHNNVMNAATIRYIRD